MAEEKDILANLASELHRGTLILCVLSQLDKAKYGYALVQSLQEKNIEIDPNTLYPLLRRLEKQGLLESQWELGETKPRKYYKRTMEGDRIYIELKKQWEELSGNVTRLMKEDGR